MYRLILGSGQRVVPNVLCTNGDTTYGCAASDYNANSSYPYTNSTIDISIEDNYLLNVIPREMVIIGSHPKSIQAQAIASRTYVFYHISQLSSIDNTANKQVFVPGTFDYFQSTLNTPNNPSTPCLSSNLNTYQTKLCTAMFPRPYIAYGGDSPAFTEFFTNIPLRTITGGQPYLLNVDDPISSYPGITQDGHGHGMSSKGASRWAYGNRGFQGNLDAWSVRWNRADQILFHYYTGVDLRLVNGTNTSLISQPDRWNPLKIENLPGSISSGGSFQVNVQVQNVGVRDWICNSAPYNGYNLVYRWERPNFSSLGYAYLANLCNVTKGDPSPTGNNLTVNVPNWGNGAYVLKFDMQKTIPAGQITLFSYFQNGPNSWPTYDINYCVGGACTAYSRFMPVITYNCSGNCSIPSQ